jgi:Haemolymph juvenile hormone binding protein (JHBP)
VLILPINGQGDLNITMGTSTNFALLPAFSNYFVAENVEYTYKFDVERVPKGNKISLKPNNHNLEFNTTRVTLKLDNLFNGQKELSKYFHVIIF